MPPLRGCAILNGAILNRQGVRPSLKVCDHQRGLSRGCFNFYGHHVAVGLLGIAF